MPSVFQLTLPLFLRFLLDNQLASAEVDETKQNWIMQKCIGHDKNKEI